MSRQLLLTASGTVLQALKTGHTNEEAQHHSHQLPGLLACCSLTRSQTLLKILFSLHRQNDAFMLDDWVEKRESSFAAIFESRS
jgi:hypothetical protein